MKQELLVFLALCAFAAAMVPKERRALNLEEEGMLADLTTTTAKPHKICAPQTPCAWSIYRPDVKIIDVTVKNTYCDCGPDKECSTGDEMLEGALIHRCRLPMDSEDSAES